ncbi:MAG: SPW repeat protein [Candidatus Liptonbacteria bacterium]|nr:SPW repeat protein [Candidatus Liptonbacteria bacterium]
MRNEKIQMALGFWLILSPWLLGFSSVSVMKWSNVIIGTAIFLINLWTVFGQEP